MNVQLIDKKESIFNTTLSLIKENGFHGTPMSQIAKSADVAIGTIYHYFPSKDNLITELFYFCKEKINVHIFDELDNQLTYKEKFFIVFKRFCAFYLQNEEIFSFMEQFYNSPFFEGLYKDEKDGPYEENKVVHFLLEGMQTGALNQIDVMILSSAYIGTAVSYAKTIIHRKELYNENNINNLVEIIWKGVKKDL